MPFGSVTLSPGVNVEKTPTALRASFSTSNLIRFKDGLVQKYGGWARFISFPVIGVPRELHAWQDLNEIDYLSVGTTQRLDVIFRSAIQPLPPAPPVNTLLDITPQTLTTNPTPNISTTINTPIVDIVDPSITNVTVLDAVFFNVPVSVGGLILDGLYQITQITGANSYQITASKNATATSSTDSLPIFTTTINTAIINVNFTASTSAAVPPGPVSVGSVVVFPIPTIVGGITIQGAYTVATVVDANNFKINASTLAIASTSVTMNGGNAQFVYYITLGPAPASTGYSIGPYSAGGYSTGAPGTGVQLGNEITATDWFLDNWGEILLALPENGGLYYWDPTATGFLNASLVSTAPPFNSGMFVSMAQQIVVLFGSTVEEAIGFQQQKLLVQWCDVSNFFEWRVNAATQAGNFTLSPGSAIIAGLAGSNQNLLWTDLDLWAMNYIGPPDVFGFNKIGAGMGAVSAKSIQQLRGSVFWMGRTNFYAYTSGGANVVPCPVWDAVFQNLNTAYLHNIRAMPNTPFNEAGWFYPSAASQSGECDSYVKMNITEPGAPWDYGPMQRSAWTDQSVLGMPIGASPQGFIYQHETTNDADGVPLGSSFQTGFFYIGEGEDFCFVDQILPDFKWGTFTANPNAQIMLTFNVTNYPGDTVRQYGPFTVTKATEFISPRFRGRLMSITVASNDLGSFWRIGSCKYRYAPAGRR